jgi:hypothetical protein
LEQGFWNGAFNIYIYGFDQYKTVARRGVAARMYMVDINTVNAELVNPKLVNWEHVFINAILALSTTPFTLYLKSQAWKPSSDCYECTLLHVKNISPKLNLGSKLIGYLLSTHLRPHTVRPTARFAIAIIMGIIVHNGLQKATGGICIV